MIPYGEDQLLSASDDKRIFLWDLATKSIIRAFDGHAGPIQSIRARDSRIVSASLDHTIRLWDVSTGRCIQALAGHSAGVWCVDIDQLRVVSGAQDKAIKVFQTSFLAKTDDTYTRSGTMTRTARPASSRPDAASR